MGKHKSARFAGKDSNSHLPSTPDATRVGCTVDGTCQSPTIPSQVVLAQAPKVVPSTQAPPQRPQYDSAAASVEKRGLVGEMPNWRPKDRATRALPSTRSLVVADTRTPRRRLVATSLKARTLLLGILIGCSAPLVLGATLVPAVATESCPNEQLRQENDSIQLPECRAYEQVSPAGPYDSEFNGVSPEGNTVFFASSGAVAGLPADTNEGTERVRMFGVSRSASGWSLSSLTNLAGQPHHTYPFIGSSADGSQMFVTSREREGAENVVPEQFSLNLYETGGHDQPLLVSHDSGGNPLTGGPALGLIGPVVVSADGSRVAFSSGTPLTPVAAASGGGPYVYEADAAGNVTLVSVMSDGELPPPGGGAGIGSTAPGEHEGKGVVMGAVTADGTTVFFNSTEQYDPSAPSGAGTQVFMHSPGATVDISKGTDNASFDAASTDGERSVFSDEGHNIYEFLATTHTLLPISSGTGGLNEFLGMSADGSHVYFASDLQLDPEVPPYAGQPFLYQWANGEITYIATISQDDLNRFTSVTEPRKSESTGRDFAESQYDQTGTTAGGPIRATGSGQYLVFESELALTEDDENNEAGRINVYEYSEGGGLVRVSGGSLSGSGNGPDDATIGSWQQLPSFDPNAGAKFQETYPFTFGGTQLDGRGITEDGSVFFSSREALAAGATTGPLHVYEWKQGRTYLISPAGAGVTDAHYLENSANGTDVYFSTAEAVLPSDSNAGWINIWDARIDGGQPGRPAAAPCADNECPGPAPAGRPTPPSMTYSGPANAIPMLSVPATRPKPATKPKALTRAQKLAKALARCKAKHLDTHQRAACERLARRRYGAGAKASTHGRRRGA
jgi:hypothetical protein